MKKALLIRGINVGGGNRLPMADLKAMLSELGASDVQTYIASGNAVFTGDIAASDISDAVFAAKGFRPRVMVLDETDFRMIARANPYPEATEVGKSLHVFYLTGPAHFDDAAAMALKADSERYHVTERAIYLHAPDGIGRSKLVEKIDKLAGVPTTARNWNTVAKLLEMLEA